jgi:hypothetical protein
MGISPMNIHSKIQCCTKWRASSCYPIGYKTKEVQVVEGFYGRFLHLSVMVPN